MSNSRAYEISFLDFFAILILFIGFYFTYLFCLIIIKLIKHYKLTGELAKFDFPDLIGDSIGGWKKLLGKKK
ncbi:hypothetical protein C9994_13525 [Marivirga lumbricoides]|uniref:Uncharacterized protein n=1 Tax=Marivirga lumbricoides TaxID=1046115 RepID=A0A2T4DG94_9BACT|nr:hypothetical protein C9994_13525 [Marivirga lumbricoides]